MTDESLHTDVATAPAASAPTLPRRGWRPILTTVLVAAALIHPLSLLVAPLHWLPEIVTHFREAGLAVALVASVAVARRRPRLALALAVVAACEVPPLLRYGGANPVAADPGAPARLKIVLANVLDPNRDYESLAALIRAERPDIVGLVEVNERWVNGLAAIRREYPYRLESPTGHDGLILWFRSEPIALDPPTTLLAGARPFLRTRFAFAGRTCTLWLAHPNSPNQRLGLPELDALSRDVAEADGSRIVIGDLNATDAAPEFRNFLHTTGLRDSRLGFGRQASWPTWSPYRIALDHLFLSDDLAVVSRRLGPEIGSDHLPLIVELAPALGRSAASRSSR